MKSILDKDFRYTSSANTDIRRTFARVRREQRRKAVEAQGLPPTPATPIAIAIFRNQKPK